MFEKSVHKDNKTERVVVQTLWRRPWLSKCHDSQYRRECNSPTPMTKVLTFLPGFSRNPQMLSIITCRSLISIFTKIVRYMSTVPTEIHLCPWTKFWFPLCLLSQNWQLTQLVLSTSVLSFTILEEETEITDIISRTPLCNMAYKQGIFLSRKVAW